MTRDDLKPALEWANGMVSAAYPGTFDFSNSKRYAPALASALREAWAEIDRLKAHLSNPLDAALNEGDGSYRP